MRKFIGLAMASTCLMTIATPALAQDSAAPAAAEEGAEDGVIIVMARRKEEALQDVPLSLQSVSGDRLDQVQVRSFVDVASTVPGLSLSRANNGIQNTVTMRGVSFNPTAAGPQTAVELYRNDVVTTSGAIFQAVYDIQSIEVLRGPQGTLRGRASPSGSLTITTRKPNLSEIGGYFQGSFAEGSEWNTGFAVNVPVFKDKLAVRVAGFASKDNGADIDRFNRFDGTTDKNHKDEIRSIRASVRAKPFDDNILILDFNYEHTTRDAKVYEQYESRGYVDGSNLFGPVDISSRDRLGISVLPIQNDGTYKFYNWQAELNLVGQKLVYVGGRLDAKSISLAPDDFAGVLANPFGPPHPISVFPAGTINPFAQYTNSQQHQRFHEIRLQNDERIAGIFDYVVGYMRLKSSTPTLLYTTNATCVGGPTNCAVGGLATSGLGGVYRIRADKEESFYGNLSAHIGDRFEISGGARRIDFKRQSGLISAARAAANPGQFVNDREPLDILLTRPPVASFALNDGTKATIYTASAKFDVTDNLLVYANYGTSFRPGNVIVCSRCNAAQGATLNAGGFLQMKNEKSNSIEAGFKASFLDKKATFNLSVFRQKFTNFTVISPQAIQFLGSYTPAAGAVPASGTLFAGTNSLALVNPVKVTGFEAEFGYRASDRFNLGGNFAYAKSKVSNGRVPCLDLNNDNIQDADAITAANAATLLPLLVAQAGAGLVDTCAISRAGAQPNFSANIQGEYNVPFGSSQGYLRGLINYNGKTRGDDVNAVDSVSSYALVNMYAGVRQEDGDWDIGLYVKNLTNTHRVLTRNGTRAQSLIANVTYGSDYYQISTIVPREFGLSFRVAFGSR